MKCNAMTLSTSSFCSSTPVLMTTCRVCSGLDPASRKQLWRTVHAAKARGGCGIVLTTHSMQEAEELCDRLCIIRDGRTVVDGTPLELTKSYGDYLQVNVQLPPARLGDVTALLKNLSPSLSLKVRQRALPFVTTFLLPFFAELCLSLPHCRKDSAALRPSSCPGRRPTSRCGIGPAFRLCFHCLSSLRPCLSLWSCANPGGL